MLNQNQKEVIAFVQEHSEVLPVERRISLYLGISDLVACPDVKEIFQSRARILEDAQRRCRELNLNFNGGQSK